MLRDREKEITMQVVCEAETQKFQNSKNCSVLEYAMNENEISGARIQLNGRYPDTGWIVNLQCKELAYIIQGSGKLVVEGKEVLLSEGAMAFIPPNEKYFWEGVMTLFITTTPAFTMEQHQQIP
jgi:mannose-6-phosphate isomerase-like protein (cupin superfamily)